MSQDGNSAFVDSDWNAYQDQWDVIYRALENRAGEEDIDSYIAKWTVETSSTFINSSTNTDRPKPWKRNIVFDKNHIYNSDNYKAVFERDLVEAERSIVISGRGLMYDKVYRIADLLQNRIESGVSVSVVLPAIELFADFDIEYYNGMVTFLESKGIEVDKVNFDNDLFAVIDENIVWHGTIDFLDKNDYWNNTLRVESASIASELLEILFDKETCIK